MQRWKTKVSVVTATPALVTWARTNNYAYTSMNDQIKIEDYAAKIIEESSVTRVCIVHEMFYTTKDSDVPKSVITIKYWTKEHGWSVVDTDEELERYEREFAGSEGS